ncbi:hypothetical protein BOX15_Mlig001002g2, partial [Macrostomum lignano]
LEIRQLTGPRRQMLRFFRLLLRVQVLLLHGSAICTVSSAAEGSAVRVLENQTFSKTLFILWDVRLFHAPEVSASTSVTLKFNGSSGDQLAVEFAAFSQQWRLATRLNRFLLPELLPAELRRASDGAILENRLRGADRDDLWEPLRGRLYIGTVDAGTKEQGWAAVTLIGDGIRAYIVTNINDYMLNVPLANQTILKRLKNSIINSRNKTNVTVSGGEIKQPLGGGGGEIKQPLGGGGGEIKQPPGGGGGEIKQPLGDGGGEIKQPLVDGGGEIKQPLGDSGSGGEINHNISKSQQPNPYLPKRTDFVNLGQLPRVPVGREIYAEFSVIIDQTWIDSLTLAYAIDRDSALVFTTELIHYAQVWYLHPSLGYRLWLRVSYVTVLNGSQSEPENFDFIKFCTSQSEWKRSFQPDFVLILTGNKRHCNGLGGVAFPSEACNSKLKARQCACVHHQKLQANTLIRAIAHEIGHLIGMPDDYAGRSSELCYSGLMRYGLYEDSGWSTCAVQNLERYLFIKDNTCLHRSETPSLSESPSPPPLPLNTAWRAPAWQSSTANDDEFVWGAWKATDGHIFGVPHENTVGKTENLLGHLGSCSQTKVEFKPWLVIELDSQLDTSNSSEELQVQVYGREECCEHHLSNLSIGIGNQRHPHGHHVCRIFENMEHFGKYKLLSFKCPATGKYLSIQSTSRENVSLSVCEVYVFQDQPARPFSHAGQTCFDKARYCDEWKMAGDCDTAHRADCRRTCGLCGPAARLKRRQPQPSPAKRQPCKDSHRYCRFFAANGLCEEKWPHCPLACDRCNSENPAASQIYLAPPKVRAPVAESTDTVTITTTTTNTVAMATEAMATASSTVVESATDKQQHVECTDKDSDCQHWAGALYCQFPHIADKHCRKSCGTCS